MIAEQHTGNLVSRTSLAGRYHNQQFHNAVVDLLTSRLDDEDIFVTNAGQDLDTGLSLGLLLAVEEFEAAMPTHISKLGELDTCWSHAQVGADVSCEVGT